MFYHQSCLIQVTMYLIDENFVELWEGGKKTINDYSDVPAAWIIRVYRSYT